jgi:hypothetical protein
MSFLGGMLTVGISMIPNANGYSRSLQGFSMDVLYKWLKRNQPTISTPGTPSNQAMPYFISSLLVPGWHTIIEAIVMPGCPSTRKRPGIPYEGQRSACFRFGVLIELLLWNDERQGAHARIYMLRRSELYRRRSRNANALEKDNRSRRAAPRRLRSTATV